MHLQYVVGRVLSFKFSTVVCHCQPESDHDHDYDGTFSRYSSPVVAKFRPTLLGFDN